MLPSLLRGSEGKEPISWRRGKGKPRWGDDVGAGDNKYMQSHLLSSLLHGDGVGMSIETSPHDRVQLVVLCMKRGHDDY
jgi:hypothetical protein